MFNETVKEIRDGKLKLAALLRTPKIPPHYSSSIEFYAKDELRVWINMRLWKETERESNR